MGKVREKGHKIPAFTLFESVVAITIISVLIGFGTMVYGNIIQSENPIGYYQVKVAIEERWRDLEEGAPALTESFDFDAYSIDQKVEPYRGNKKLLEVTFYAYLGEKKVWVEKHLLVNENEG